MGILNCKNISLYNDEQIKKIMFIQNFWKFKHLSKKKSNFLHKKILPGKKIFFFDENYFISKEQKKTQKRLRKINLDQYINFYCIPKGLVKIILLYKDNLIYDGLFNLNKMTKEGLGIEYNLLSGTKYEGLFKNDKKNGFGRIIFFNGAYYEGEFKDNSQHGKGLFIYNKYVYNGMWKYNKRWGFGEEIDSEGNIYNGFFFNDKKEGPGIIKYKQPNTGLYYKSIECCFRNNIIAGITRCIHNNNKISLGFWNNNKLEGINVVLWKSGEKYLGEYKNFHKNGFGLYFYNKNEFYAGFWLDGKQHGYGQIKFKENNYTNELSFFENGKLINFIDNNNPQYERIYRNIIEEKRMMNNFLYDNLGLYNLESTSGELLAIKICEYKIDKKK